MLVSLHEVIGPAVVWLLQSPDADGLKAKRIHSPGITHKYGLLDGWDDTGTLYPRPDQRSSAKASATDSRTVGE